MAGENEAIAVPSTLAVNLPEQGNAKVDPSKVNTNGSQLNNENLTPEERLHLADQMIKEKEAKAKAEQEEKDKQAKANQGKKGDEKPKDDEDNKGDENEPSDEEVEAKLKELETKKEEELTNEDKEFIEKYTPVDEVTSVKKDFEATYGIKLDNDYENSPEGLKLLAADIAPLLGEQMFMGYLKQVPYMEDFFQHVAIEGKSIETFLAKNETPTFSTIDIKPLAEIDEAAKPAMINNLKTLVSLDLTAKGNDKDTIQTLVDLYESNGTLFDKAKAAKENLAKIHKAQVDARIKEEEGRIAENKQAIQQEIKAVQDMITKNNFNGVSLPAGDIKAFQDALLKPIDSTGRTVMDAKRENLTLAERTLIDYIVFKGFKVKGLQGNVAPSRSFNFSKEKNANDQRKGRRIASNSGDSRVNKDENPTGLNIKTFFN